MTAEEPLFIAPPAPTKPAAPSSGAGPRIERTVPDSDAVSMTKGARDAAGGQGVDVEQVRECLTAPEEIAADGQRRTRFRRGKLTVVAGSDGTVIRVSRSDGSGNNGGGRRRGRRRRGRGRGRGRTSG